MRTNRTPKPDITDLLNRVADSSEHDSVHANALYEQVYDDLLYIARAQLRRLGPGQTLNTTGLVHESFLRLTAQAGFENRGHFFAVSAKAMRQILIDRARRRNAQKRGSGVQPISLDVVASTVDGQAQLVLWLDHALDRLQQENSRWARVAECRFFGGYSEAETAEALDVSRATVQRDSIKAKAWLRRTLATETATDQR